MLQRCGSAEPVYGHPLEVSVASVRCTGSKVSADRPSAPCRTIRAGRPARKQQTARNSGQTDGVSGQIGSVAAEAPAIVGRTHANGLEEGPAHPFRASEAGVARDALHRSGAGVEIEASHLPLCRWRRGYTVYSPSYTSFVKNFESITNLPHLSSKAAVGFAAMMSSRDFPCDFSATTLSRTVTSISRNSIN